MQKSINLFSTFRSANFGATKKMSPPLLFGKRQPKLASDFPEATRGRRRRRRKLDPHCSALWLTDCAINRGRLSLFKMGQARPLCLHWPAVGRGKLLQPRCCLRCRRRRLHLGRPSPPTSLSMASQTVGPWRWRSGAAATGAEARRLATQCALSERKSSGPRTRSESIRLSAHTHTSSNKQAGRDAEPSERNQPAELAAKG